MLDKCLLAVSLLAHPEQRSLALRILLRSLGSMLQEDLHTLTVTMACCPVQGTQAACSASSSLLQSLVHPLPMA